MEKDFHYYGTYAAAKIAGYNTSEAVILARAAQFVDDCTHENIKGHEDNYTCTGISNISLPAFAGGLSWSRLGRIWIPFHFLPQDVTAPDPLIAADGAQTQEIIHLSRLICGPNGKTVDAVLDDTINMKEYYQAYDKMYDYLYLIGIRAHVLADTFAHQQFSGVPIWQINDVCNVKDLGTEKTQNFWSYTPPSPGSKNNYVGACYFGHGRAGHFPDAPASCYEYELRRGNTLIKQARNNFNIYFSAFDSLVQLFFNIRSVSQEERNQRWNTEMKNNVLLTLMNTSGTSNDHNASQFENALSEPLGILRDLGPVPTYCATDLLKPGTTLDNIPFDVSLFFEQATIHRSSVCRIIIFQIIDMNLPSSLTSEIFNAWSTYYELTLDFI